MWSEEIKRLGAALDKLQVELAKQYRNKGGKTRPLVCKICDVLEAIWSLVDICHMTDAIRDELADRMEKRQLEQTQNKEVNT